MAGKTQLIIFAYGKHSAFSPFNKNYVYSKNGFHNEKENSGNKTKIHLNGQGKAVTFPFYCALYFIENPNKL